MFEEADIVYSYTRKQALADGFQVDVSEVAKEAGFRFSVYMTRTVWTAYVEVPEGVHGQDEQGRLWDVLSMLRWQVKKGGNPLTFRLYVRNDNRRARIVPGSRDHRGYERSPPRRRARSPGLALVAVHSGLPLAARSR